MTTMIVIGIVVLAIVVAALLRERRRRSVGGHVKPDDVARQHELGIDAQANQPGVPHPPMMGGPGN